MEDLYDKNLYRQAFLDRFGVDPKARPKGRRNQKWSNVMERLFRDSCKPWNEAMKQHVKDWLARYAAENPDKIIVGALEGPLGNFIATVERKLVMLE